MENNISLTYNFGYLVKRWNKSFIKKELTNEDVLIDSGLIIKPLVNNESKGYFLGNKLVLDKFNKGECQNIIFEKDILKINDYIFDYSDLELQISKDAAFLSINDFSIFNLSSSFNHLLDENNIKIFNKYEIYQIIIFNELLYLCNKNNNKVHEINLHNNMLIYENDETVIYCQDYEKSFSLDKCFIKSFIENNIYNVLIQVEDNEIIITLGHCLIH